MRTATLDDLPSILSLLADDEMSSGRDDATLPLDVGYLKAFEALSSDSNQMLVVAEQNGAIVGTMQLSFVPGLSFRGSWRCHVEAVRVASNLRGQGVGAGMMRWALARARDRGCRMVQFMSKRTRTNAHRFYERLGFDKSHFGFKLVLVTEEAA